MIRFALPLAFVAAAVATPPSWPDCNETIDVGAGVFTPTTFLNVTYNKTMFYGTVPAGPGPFPLVVFMHGSTGQWEMYSPNLEIYASHGFVVVFPFIKSPEKDKNPLTTNTDGTFILKGVEYAKAANTDPSSPLHGKVDPSHVIVAGHSMGASCSIMAAKRLPPGVVKLVITQHPGICGPFGPPPWPSTWMPSDLVNANTKSPIIFTTATNDGAFWPAPHTAEHELGCLKQAQKAKLPGPIAFVQFTAAACAEDGKRKPFTDEGHNCPFKAEVETPWVLRALKLYGQHEGSRGSACYGMLWGNGTTSVSRAPTVKQTVIMAPTE